MTTSSVGSALPFHANIPFIHRPASTERPAMGDAFTARQFDWLNQVIADATLPAAAFKLAYVISRHINREKGYAWPGQASLAKSIGATVRTVRDLTDRLVAGGHLAVEPHCGRNQTNQYRLVSKGKPASAPAHETGKIETPNEEVARTKTGSGLPTNPLKNPLMNPEGNSNFGREEEGFWIKCDTPQADAWQRYWRATGQREPIRSGRTGYYLKKVPTEYPPGVVG
jgi:hypothetical protein